MTGKPHTSQFLRSSPSAVGLSSFARWNHLPSTPITDRDFTPKIGSVLSHVTHIYYPEAGSHCPACQHPWSDHERLGITKGPVETGEPIT